MNRTPSTSVDDAAEVRDVRAAFVNINSRDDLWVDSHVRAARSVESAFDWLDTSFFNEVGTDPADHQRVFRDLAEDGYDIVFGNAFDYMDVLLELSEEYLGTAWENCSGIRTGRNCSWYHCRVYQAFFLAGIAAGHLTESDTLGYVASFPIPHTYRQIDAFTLGARTVMPDITTRVEYVGTWFDPGSEEAAARRLVEDGVDVLTHITNSDETARVASEEDVWVVGQYTSQQATAGDRYVTAAIPSWERHYAKEIRAVRSGEWRPDPDWGGIAEGYVRLDEWGPAVPDAVSSHVAEATETYFLDGERSLWEGTSLEPLSEGELYTTLDSFVPGVEADPSAIRSRAAR
jgi:basic membrane lipoprotein Med (substrate-binding protein (PBP1-ABC) superfamily)